jgi:hypothetical protein
MQKLYLRKAGRTTPIPAMPGVRHKVWGVRVDGSLVGYVTAGRHPISRAENIPGFRGFTAAGAPVTTHDTDRTRVRNLTAARRDWS